MGPRYQNSVLLPIFCSSHTQHARSSSFIRRKSQECENNMARVGKVSKWIIMSLISFGFDAKHITTCTLLNDQSPDYHNDTHYSIAILCLIGTTLTTCYNYTHLLTSGKEMCSYILLYLNEIVSDGMTIIE